MATDFLCAEDRIWDFGRSCRWKDANYLVHDQYSVLETSYRNINRLRCVKAKCAKSSSCQPISARQERVLTTREAKLNEAVTVSYLVVQFDWLITAAIVFNDRRNASFMSRNVNCYYFTVLFNLQFKFPSCLCNWLIERPLKNLPDNRSSVENCNIVSNIGVIWPNKGRANGTFVGWESEWHQGIWKTKPGKSRRWTAWCR